MTHTISDLTPDERDIVLAAIKSDILLYRTHISHARPGDPKWPRLTKAQRDLESALEKLNAAA